MLATKSTTFISAPLHEAVTTGVDTESSVIHDRGREDVSREEWQRLIDYQLIEWGWNSGQLDADDVPSPSRDTVQRAIELAEMLCQKGVSAPTRVVPDAHGGIVFEREAGNMFGSIRISADGSVEYCEFENCRMVQRQPWASEMLVRGA